MKRFATPDTLIPASSSWPSPPSRSPPAAAGRRRAPGHAGRHKAAMPKRPNVVFLIFDEWPIDVMINSAGQIDPVRYPNLAALTKTGDVVPQRAHHLRLDDARHPAGDGRRARAQGDDAGLRRPSAHGLRPASAATGTGSAAARRRPRSARRATAAAPSAADPRSSSSCRRAAAIGSRASSTRSRARQADPLPQAHAAAARALPVPPVGQADARRLAGPDPRDEQPAGGFGDRFLTEHNLQRRGAPDRLRRPRARPAVRPDEARGDLRQHPDRDHRRPRHRVRGRRQGPPHGNPRRTSTRSRRCRCSSRRRARPRAARTARTCAPSTSCRRSPTSSTSRCPTAPTVGRPSRARPSGGGRCG